MKITRHFIKTSCSNFIVLSLLGLLCSAYADPLALSPSLSPSTQSISQLVPSEFDDVPTQTDRQRESINLLESQYGPYDHRLKEALKGLGFQLKNAGDYFEAKHAYRRALQISRVNEGLYNPSQVSIVERLIELDFGLGNWQAVNDHYGYLEHLYKRIYKVDDPRLEEGLRKVVAWHIDASNINLDGNRLEHLRKVNLLFKLRLQVAELTLSGEDPLFDFLKQKIKQSEYYLYMASDLNREIRQHRKRSVRDRYLATSD